VCDRRQHIARSLDRLQPLEFRLQRFHSRRVDRRFVHAARVEIPHHPLDRGRARGLRRHALADRAEILLVILEQLREIPPPVELRRHRILLQPRAVGVTVKVVLRLHRQVEILQVDLGASPQGEGKRDRRSREETLCHIPTIRGFPEPASAL
jgi:hypothetical protein